MTRTFRPTRRAALAGFGATGVAGLLRPLLARAQGTTGPQRLLLIHRPIGTVPEKWFPTGGITDWVTSPILAPFEKLRSDMVVMKGLDCPRRQEWLGNKCAAGLLTMMSPPPMDKGPDMQVWPALPSYSVAEQEDTNGQFLTSTDKTIDQLFLQKIPGLQGARIPSVQLGCSQESADVTQSACMRVVSYAKQDPLAQYPTPLWPEVRPGVALSNIFGGAMGMTPRDIASQALDKSLLDFVSNDLSRLRVRLPPSQFAKIDAHLSAIRDLERNASLTGSARACTAPALSPLPSASGFANQNEAQYVDVCKQQLQIVKAAFECDLTRVISLTYAYTNSGLHFSNILPPGSIEDVEGHYNIGHHGGSNPEQALEATDTFYSAMTASLLLDLKNTPDAGGPSSLLDNTLVVYFSETCVCNAHSTTDMPVLVFGGKFLNVQGGRYLQFPHRFMTDFWVQTAQAWGYKEMTSYGESMWNTGPLPGLYG